MVKKITSIIQGLRVWQQWGFHWIYGPVYPLFIWYIIRSRFRFFFTASNPGIENGGFVMESKMKIYEQLPSNLIPQTLFFEKGAEALAVKITMEKSGLGYPVILKPDIGGGGRAVMLVRDELELDRYLAIFKMNFLLQEFIHYPNEIGLFLVKYPATQRVVVTGITGKTQVAVTGDGIRPLGLLIRQNPRLNKNWGYWKKQCRDRLNDIIPEGIEEILIPVGNRRRGASYSDWSHLVSKELRNLAVDIVNQIPGFYYGRLDIKYKNWDDFLGGKNFSIIEVNGAGSGPAHIFDDRHSIFFAWREIARHFRMLFRVSRQNHNSGYPFMSFSDGVDLLRANHQYDLELNALHGSLMQMEPVGLDILSV
jgi:hypothetical protein